MISFEDYKEVYYSEITNEQDLNHLEVEFDEQVDTISRLDKSKDYSREELISLLFDKRITSQTTFYRRRRGLTRIATIEGFDYSVIRKIDTIDFDEVFNEDIESFKKEYFGSLEELYSEIQKIQSLNSSYDRTGAFAVTGLLWSGLTFAEVTRLKISDLDLTSSTVTIKRANRDIKFELDDKVVKYIRQYMKKRVSTGAYVFVGKSGDKAHRTTTNKMIISLNEFSDKRFLSKNITYSGWFYRIYNKKQENDIKMLDIKIKYNIWKSAFT